MMLSTAPWTSLHMEGGGLAKQQKKQPDLNTVPFNIQQHASHNKPE